METASDKDCTNHLHAQGSPSTNRAVGDKQLQRAASRPRRIYQGMFSSAARCMHAAQGARSCRGQQA